MKGFLAKIIFKTIGWKTIGGNEYDDKCVVICAPHTSNWDFFIGMCYSYIMGIEFKFLMKKELFIPILSYLIKYNGGIPVERKVKSNLVDDIVTLFNEYQKLYFVITPEGTRSYTDKWRTGFYYIALKAKVPILLLKMDYMLKEVGIICQFNPTGDFIKDMSYIESQYINVTAKKPQFYNRNIN